MSLRGTVSPSQETKARPSPNIPQQAEVETSRDDIGGYSRIVLDLLEAKASGKARRLRRVRSGRRSKSNA